MGQMFCGAYHDGKHLECHELPTFLHGLVLSRKSLCADDDSFVSSDDPAAQTILKFAHQLPIMIHRYQDTELHYIGSISQFFYLSIYASTHRVVEPKSKHASLPELGYDKFKELCTSPITTSQQRKLLEFLIGRFTPEAYRDSELASLNVRLVQDLFDIYRAFAG